VGTDMTKKNRNARDVYPGLNVLRTESKADVAKMFADITEGVGTIDIFVEMYARDAAFYNLETMRYQRIITGTLNNALKSALERILRQIVIPSSSLTNPKILIENWRASESLSSGWLTDPEDQRKVSELLKEAGLDESAIEAEAYRSVADTIEHAHRMLKISEEGRERALRSIFKHQKRSAAIIRRNADRVLAADQVAAIANNSVN
jgi:hypothetical protein